MLDGESQRPVKPRHLRQPLAPVQAPTSRFDWRARCYIDVSVFWPVI